MTPRLASYLGLSLSGFHRLAYWEWGPQDAKRTLICVHGLTRQGRDFDILARTFVRRGWRVICPDLVGRGQSGWLTQPAGYTLLQYGADMNALLARLDVEEVDWVGNSLGGLIGMMLAAQPENPIRRLVLNDIGPLHPRPCPAPARRLPQCTAAALRRPGCCGALHPHDPGPVR